LSQKRHDVIFDAATVAEERSLGLGTFAFPQHEALLGSGKVIAAEIGNRCGASGRLASSRRILTMSNAPEGLASLPAGFVGR
jgi:hypothetical protein